MITNKIDYKVYSNKPFAIWANSRIINERLSANSYNRDYLDFAKAKNTFNFKKVSDIAKVTAMIGWKGLTTDDYVDEDGVYLLRTVDIKDNYIDLENAIMAKREKVYEQPQIILKQGDIIFSKDGTLGITAIVPRHQNKEMCVGSTLARIRLNSNLDNYYVCAAFMSKIVQAQIGYFTSGIAQPHITQEYINKLEIPIPSPEIQKYIGDKVRKAEELREEAKKLKKEAEGIIYKELNFGSLEDKLKIINNKYTWVGLHNLGIRIDSKYYNEKVLRIKDYFNKHYETIKLKECLQHCSRGKSFAESSEDGIILIKTKNLNNSFINYERNFVYEKEVNNNLILKEKDLIFASMGVGSLGKIDMYYPSEEKATIDGTLMLLRFKSDSKLKPEYVMEFLRTHIGQKLIYQNVVGSTGIISISVDDLINIDIPYIDDEKQEKISNFTNKYLTDIYASKRLIQEAKQDVEDLIEGNFDMSKIKAHS